MELFYRHYGSGEPVIILHGMFGMSDNWATFSKKLAGYHYSVYTPDIRNHGNSPHSDIFNFDVLSEDLKDFILQYEIKKPVLIGHSLGGKVVMNFVQRFPDLARKIIIIDMGLISYKIHNDDVLSAMISANITSKKSRYEIEEELSKRIKYRKVVQLMMKNVQREKDNSFRWKPNLESLMKNFHEIFKPVDILPKVNIPALFVAADKSEYISKADLQTIRKTLPCSDIVAIPGSSHWVHSDKPEELLRIVTEFIKNND